MASRAHLLFLWLKSSPSLSCLGHAASLSFRRSSNAERMQLRLSWVALLGNTYRQNQECCNIRPLPFIMLTSFMVLHVLGLIAPFLIWFSNGITKQSYIMHSHVRCFSIPRVRKHVAIFYRKDCIIISDLHWKDQESLPQLQGEAIRLLQRECRWSWI